MYHLFIALQVLGIVLTFGAEVLLLYGDGSMTGAETNTD